MDKILTRKILGLKIGDILKCVILVVIGYCIAVMLGNFNCVEGLWVCNNKTECSVEECAADDAGDCGDNCDGWYIDKTGIMDQNGDGIPRVFRPNLIYTCAEDSNSQVGYQDEESCNAVAKGNIGNDHLGSTSTPACPNPAPTPPAPTPTPPTPATPVTPRTQAKAWVCSPNYGDSSSCDEWTVGQTNFPPGPKFPTKEECSANCSPPPPVDPPTPSDCTYSGDKYTGPTHRPLNQEWWKESAGRCGSCSTNITNCRKDMKNYLKYVEGVEPEKLSEAYNGFCLQTVGESISGERGDCGRIQLTKQLHKDCDTSPGSDACIDDKGQPIYIANPAYVSEEGRACKSYRDGSTFADMAWVKDSLTSQCNANCPDPADCTTTTTASPGCQYCGKLGACNQMVETESVQASLCCEVGSPEWKATWDSEELSCDDLGESAYVKKALMKKLE